MPKSHFVTRSAHHRGLHMCPVSHSSYCKCLRNPVPITLLMIVYGRHQNFTTAATNLLLKFTTSGNGEVSDI